MARSSRTLNLRPNSQFHSLITLRSRPSLTSSEMSWKSMRLIMPVRLRSSFLKRWYSCEISLLVTDEARQRSSSSDRHTSSQRECEFKQPVSAAPCSSLTAASCQVSEKSSGSNRIAAVLTSPDSLSYLRVPRSPPASDAWTSRRPWLCRKWSGAGWVRRTASVNAKAE